MRLGLTKRMSDVVAFIEGFMEIHRFAPSQTEIARGLNVSQTRVHQLLNDLETRGWITRRPGSSRSIVLIDKPTSPPETTA